MSRDGGAGGGVLAACRRASSLPARRLAPSVATGALSSACAIGLLATSGWLITRASTRPPVFVISVAVGAVQAFALGRGLFRYLQRLRVHDLALGVIGGLRLRLFDDVEPLVPGGLPAGGDGAVLSAFVSDTELVAQGLAQGTTAAVDVTASVVLGVLVAALVAPRPALVLAAAAVATVGVALVAGRLGRHQAEVEADLRAELAATVVDAVRGARELAAYGRRDVVEAELAAVRRRAMAAARRQGLVGGLGRAATTWVAGAGLVAVVGVGLAGQRADHLSGVLLAVAVFAALATFDQLVAVPAVLADTGAAGAAARRLARLAGRPVPAVEPDRPAVPPTGPVGATLDELVVAGSGGRHLLDGVTLQVPPGRRVAMVGPSGAGKTTAVRTLLHFLDPVAGRAAVGGVDVRDLRRVDLAGQVGWMAEDTHLFAAPLGDNLRIARPAATDDDCVGVLARVGLGPWFAGLPDGLGTALGAGGRAVSAGERQRLGMARALLADTPVLVLDEPTAHVDPSSSGRLLGELLDAAEERAVLVVSHEPDIAAHVDQVVSLRAGRVADPGD